MAVSVFDLFKIGIGPSSSHTVGPMRAALMFASGLEADGLLPQVASVRVELYGSLGATGKGHGTDRGVILGLMGEAPDTIDPDTIETKLAALRASQSLSLLGRHAVRFTEKEHIAFYRREAMAEHPNGMKFHAFDAAGERLRRRATCRWAAVLSSRRVRRTRKCSPRTTSCPIRSAAAATC
jgi:L-serine dehydratase